MFLQQRLRHPAELLCYHTKRQSHMLLCRSAALAGSVVLQLLPSSILMLGPWNNGKGAAAAVAAEADAPAAAAH